MPKRTSNQKTQDLQVILTVRGGVAHMLFKPEGVAVAIYDYDWEAAAESDPRLSRDPGGNHCLYQEWPASKMVQEETRWPLIKKAKEGTYSRSWKCPRCGQLAQCSYEDLAVAGTPMCTDCDIEMELQ
jgi:hypothetical protein